MAAPASLAMVLLLVSAMAPCSSALEQNEVRSIEAAVTGTAQPPTSKQRATNPALLGLLALALVMLRYFFGKRRAAAIKGKSDAVQGDAQKGLKVVPCDLPAEQQPAPANEQEAPSTAEVEAFEPAVPVFAGAPLTETVAAKVEEVVKLVDVEPAREYQAPEAELHENVGRAELYESVDQEFEIPLGPAQEEAVADPTPAPAAPEEKLEEADVSAFVRMDSNSSSRSATSATSNTRLLSAPMPAQRNPAKHWTVGGGPVQLPPTPASWAQVPGASVEVSPQGRAPPQRGLTMPINMRHPSIRGAGTLRSQPIWRAAPATTSPRVVTPTPAMTSPRMAVPVSPHLDGSTRSVGSVGSKSSNHSVPVTPRGSTYLAQPVVTTRKRANSREITTMTDPYAGA